MGQDERLTSGHRSGRQIGALAGQQSELADELPGPVADHHLVGFVVPDHIDGPFHHDEEVPQLLSGTIENVARGEFDDMAELGQLVKGLRFQDRKSRIVGHHFEDRLLTCRRGRSGHPCIFPDLASDPSGPAGHLDRSHGEVRITGSKSGRGSDGQGRGG